MLGINIHTEQSTTSAEGASRDANSNNGVSAKLRALEGMDYDGLRSEWRRLYRAHPPKRVSRDLLMLGVAWKIQEKAYGGLSAATKRRLADLAKTLERDGNVAHNRVARVKPGAKFIRTWRGETHKVVVLKDGFEWKGRRWRSLSAIAWEITGVHSSGPRFFGVNGKASRQAGTRIEGPASA